MPKALPKNRMVCLSLEKCIPRLSADILSVELVDSHSHSHSHSHSGWTLVSRHVELNPVLFPLSLSHSLLHACNASATSLCHACQSIDFINAPPTRPPPPFLVYFAASFSFINRHPIGANNTHHEGISSNGSKSPLATQHHPPRMEEETSCSYSSSGNSKEEDVEEEEEEEGVVRKVRNSVMRVGKKIVITGAVISSTPIFVPPLLVGFVFAVPFGFVFATYACTHNLMSKLLSETHPSRRPSIEEDQAWKEREELVDDIKKTPERRIEFVEDYQRGSVELSQQEYEWDYEDEVDVEENLDKNFEEVKDIGSERNGVMGESIDDGYYVDYGRLEEEEEGVDDGTGKWSEGTRESGGGGYAGEVDDGTWEAVGMERNVLRNKDLMNERYGVMEESRDGEVYFDNEKIEQVRSVDDSTEVGAVMKEDKNVQDVDENAEDRMIGGEAFVTGEEDGKLGRNTEEEREEDANNEQNFINMVVEERLSSGGQDAEEIVEVEGIPVEETFISSKGEEMLVKDSENVIEEAQELLENIELQVEQMERDEAAIIEEKDGRNFGNTEDEVEIPIEEILEPIERDDEPIVERKGVMQEGMIPAEKILEEEVARDFSNAEQEVEVPIEKTLEPIERDDESVVDRKGVMQEDKEAWNVCSTVEEEIPAKKILGSIEQDNEPITETGEVKQDDSSDLNMGLNMEEEEMPVEDTSIIIEEENLGEMPAEDTSFSIEEEELGETVVVGQGARHKEDADKMMDVEEVPVQLFFDKTEEKQVPLLSKKNEVMENIRDEESLGKIPVQEQISEDETEQRGIEQRRHRNIAHDGKEGKPHEMEIGIVKESRNENRWDRVQNDHVEGTVEATKDEDVEIAKKDEGEKTADYNSQQEEAMMSTGETTEKKIKESVPDSTLEVIMKTTIPAKQVLNKVEEEKIWQEIDSIKKIVGYKAAPKATCTDEINTLYHFTGVEPPLVSKDSSDLPAIHDKLRLLMAIIGVK